MEIRTIRSEANYKAVLAEVSVLIELDPGASPRGRKSRAAGRSV